MRVQMKTRCPRCGIPRSERQKLVHQTGVWHRKFFHIQRLLRRGKALTEIAANLRCSRVLIAKCAKLAGSINPLNAELPGH